MNAAECAIQKFGGVSQLAKAIGRDRTSVWRWTQPTSKGGTGGFIPTRNVPLILEVAKKRGISFKKNELYVGSKSI